MKVSIITIAYNNLDGLRDTYQSIKRQTFGSYEWIVVDGGSTDGTKEFLQEHDSEIAWWCCEPDRGVYNAQNKGTEHARAEYCIYMNSGDSFYEDDVLERIFERQTDADIIYGDWMLIFQDGTTRLGPAPEVPDMAYFFNENICHQSMLVKTEIILNRPYDESFSIYGDWDEWLNAFMQGKRFERVDIVICKFIVGGLSTGESNTLDTKRKVEMQRLKEKYYPEPWRKTMSRVGSIVQEYNALKNYDSTSSLSTAFYEREFLIMKRRKHNIIIRILIYISSFLLVTNILTLLFFLCK